MESHLRKQFIEKNPLPFKAQFYAKTLSYKLSIIDTKLISSLRKLHSTVCYFQSNLRNHIIFPSLWNEFSISKFLKKNKRALNLSFYIRIQIKMFLFIFNFQIEACFYLAFSIWGLFMRHCSRAVTNFENQPFLFAMDLLYLQGKSWFGSK